MKNRPHPDAILRSTRQRKFVRILNGEIRYVVCGQVLVGLSDVVVTRESKPEEPVIALTEPFENNPLCLDDSLDNVELAENPLDAIEELDGIRRLAFELVENRDRRYLVALSERFSERLERSRQSDDPDVWDGPTLNGDDPFEFGRESGTTGNVAPKLEARRRVRELEEYGHSRESARNNPSDDITMLGYRKLSVNKPIA